MCANISNAFTKCALIMIIFNVRLDYTCFVYAEKLSTGRTFTRFFYIRIDRFTWAAVYRNFNFTFWFQFSKTISNQLVYLKSILLHSIQTTAFYLFDDKPKKSCFMRMISDYISCVCWVLIHLFDDSLFSPWSFV